VRRLIGIVEEGKEVMEEFEDSQALDWALPAAAQAAEHSSVASFTAPTIEPGPNGFFSQLSSGENASKAVAVRPGPSKR